MARRGRSIDHSYAHNLIVRPIMTPLIAARSTWQDDELKQETLDIAAGLIPEPPAAPAPDDPAPVPATPKPRKAKTAKKVVKPAPVKPAPATKFTTRIAWGPDGTVLGWRVGDTEEIEPISNRPTRRKTQQEKK